MLIKLKLWWRNQFNLTNFTFCALFITLSVIKPLPITTSPTQTTQTPPTAPETDAPAMTEVANTLQRKDDTASKTSQSDVESVQSLLKSPVASMFSDEVDQASNAQQYLSISRPLSRASVTSGLSVTATKDGVEGKTVKRHGIPGYPLNLINKMYSNYQTRSGVPPDSDTDEEETVSNADRVSVESLKSVSMSSMIPHYAVSEATRDVSDSEVYGEDTVEFDRESKTDYEKFLMRRPESH